VHDKGGLAGHPKALTTLFFTEMWERFSFYGMKAILIYYMVATLAEGGLGWSNHFAGLILGVYILGVYLAAVPGGIVADRWLGARRAVFVGGVIIAAGQFLMVVPSLYFSIAGLVTIVVGTGLLKPNISAMLGELYSKDDPRRDSGFSLFYMGINLGAAMAPLACGILAQTDWFRSVLSAVGLNPNWSWHFGFGVAGVGMLLGLLQLWIHRERLAKVGRKPERQQVTAGASGQSLTSQEWLRIGAIAILFFFTALFWSVYEQSGSSLSLFAKELTRTEVFGISFPASFFQSLNPFLIIFLAPVFSKLWDRLGDRQPSSTMKFVFGLTLLGMGIALMVPASLCTAGGAKVGPGWLFGVYAFSVVGELCLSPVGLSTVTQLAPPRLKGFMLGIWFLAAAIGGFTAGFVGGYFVAGNPHFLAWFYGVMALALFAAAGVLALLRPVMRKLMGGVR
jgi:POT family proton-dependent oligopeptide transporter